MSEFFNNLFSNVFGDNIILATILIAMIPVVELRGAIPFATNTKIWNSLALSNWSAFGWSLLGSSAIVPIIALVFTPLIKLLKKTKFFGKIANFIENRVKNKAKSINSNNLWKKLLGVFIFVAIPLPLTGVWTGTCVAIFLGLNYWQTCLTVISGNIVAGLLISLILEFFPALNDYLIWIFLLILALVIVYELIKFLIEKRKNNGNIDK